MTGEILIGDAIKGTIVFPEGAKISIELGTIDCTYPRLTLSTLKELKAMS